MDTPMDTPKTTARAHVVSATPGRTRVRLAPGHRHNPRLMENVKADLQQQPGVAHVKTNSRTGSLTVHYDRSTVSHDGVLALLRDVGIVAERTFAALGEDVPSDASTTGLSVNAALDDLNRRLLGRTGGALDLKFLFPATLTVVGLRQLFTTGLGIAEVPAYILLWYAFDSFYKFHHHETVQPVAASSPGAGAAEASSERQARESRPPAAPRANRPPRRRAAEA